MIALDILTDGFFAAIAGIGFGAISDPPLRAFKMIAILAALGHACRFCLMTYLGVDIATGSLFAGLVIGFGSLWLGKKVYCPMTVPLDKITITDITTDCGISRMAFYYHFKDIYDLVEIGRASCRERV